MSLLPIFLKLAGRRCLVVGAGEVAREKIAHLLKTELNLTVVAPEAHLEVQQWAAAGLLEWLERPFEAGDLEGRFLTIAATNAPEINAAVYRGCVERGILANSVDDIPHCDFFFGSVVSREALQIAISTSGESPALAQQLRHEIDAQLPADLGDWLANLGQLRRQVLETHPRSVERRLLLHRLAQRHICDSPNCPSRQLAQSQIAEEPAEEYGELSASVLPVREANPPAETVYLVGAGPGDPELLTVKAVRLIQTADVILHDGLVPQTILDLASPSAEIVNVGKRCGEKMIAQEEIDALMIDHARAGRSLVRLKGGDPTLFGRAAEELAALAAAGVPVEIVPGVTAASAAAAALGCSLTERGGASGVVFTTGHRAPQAKVLPAEKALATRVVYMPGRDLAPLAEEWLREGLPPDLPCALVSRAALPGQEIERTTLDALAAARPMLAPSLLIAGWAVGRLMGQGD
jgi:uroporphyrin-III C-methyltransferase/precorrin-2 dehydrogenase/sirohydrochlorin ferrochelatase